MKTIRIVALILLFVPLLFVGCDDSGDAESIYKFTVRSTGNSFTGYYSVDGEQYDILIGDIKHETGDYYYIYEKNLENPTHVDINVDGFPIDCPETPDNDLATKSIHIQFFENGDCVKEAKKTKTIDDEQIEASLPWDYTADTKTDTTDTTDTTK